MDQSQPDGFLALPPAGAGPGVLVLHAWWGMNDTIKQLCTRLAQEGFVAFAPDLYHGKVATTREDAKAFGSEVDGKYLESQKEVAAAARFLSERAGQPDGKIAVIGFSMGAYYAMELAAQDPEHVHAVVLFYGTAGGDWSKSQATYLGHFAGDDEFEPLAGVDELQQTLQNLGRPVTFHVYPNMQHWFFEHDRPEYDEDAARLAWERTLNFLKRA